MESRLIKPKGLLLKDYLLDDMSSCSSNGFKSFPRRQCCTSTVRFLIQIDHKNKQQRKSNNKYLNFNQTQLAAFPKLSRPKSAISALRSVIAAVKRLPFSAASPPENKNLNRKWTFLPRSISLKKTSFWGRKTPSKKEIGRWKSFDELLKEDSEPSDISNSKSRSRNGFTAPDECRSGNSPSSDDVNMDLTDQVRNDTVELLKNGDVSTDSTTNSSTKQKQWAVSEDKEQLSPVSVLDCPFDDDEEVSSPYHHGTEGGTHMQKMKRFAHLEPVSLAKQFELHPPNSSNKCTGPIEDEQVQENDYESQAEQKALNLLNQMDDINTCSSKIKANTLLLDFFRENTIARSQRRQCCDDRELLEEAENWMNERKPRELFLGWEASGNREAYIKDMEKTKEWKLLYDEENYMEVAALELGDEVFDALLNELLLDISSTF